MREIVLDTETTGLDPYSGHRIVEIGCVELENHLPTGNVFHTYLNPERDMPPEAERVHGLSHHFLKDKPLFKAVAGSFLEFIAASPLVIHNAQFDLKFLNAELEALNLPIFAKDRAIDTVLIARKKYPGQPAGLDALCRRFNIDLSQRTKHGALLDAELLADVYLELCGGRQSALTLKNDDAVLTDGMHITGHSGVEPRTFLPSDEERAAHKAMLEKMTDAIWKKLSA